LLHHS